MAKKRVECPDCGYRFTVRMNGVRSTVTGVHSRRLTNNQFEYTAIMPGHLSFNDGDQEEIKKFYTISEQALLVGLVGLSAGSLVGFLASQPFPIEYSLQIIPACILAGITIALSNLAAERSCILNRALPWFGRLSAQLQTVSQEKNNEVSLTIDHRYRDGHTEAGRTINRFGALPVDVDRFNEWVQGALVGKSLAVPNWTPRAKLFTRPEYDQLLVIMKGGNIVANLGSNKGNTLTGGGRRALARHLSDCGITPPSPASEEDFLGERLVTAVANNGGNTPLPRSEVRAGGQNER